MRSCRRARWDFSQSIKVPDRPPNTESAKELQEKLAKLDAERKKQDQIWLQPASNASTQDTTSTKCTSS